MKKENLKKVIVPTMLVTIIVIIVFTIILKLQYKNYETIVNNTIVDIIAVVREKYPQVSEEEIISILQNKDTIDKNNENYKIIKKYGYKDNISYIRELEEKEKELQVSGFSGQRKAYLLIQNKHIPLHSPYFYR